jgi:hypothetical protein
MDEHHNEVAILTFGAVLLSVSCLLSLMFLTPLRVESLVSLRAVVLQLTHVHFLQCVIVHCLSVLLV